MNQKIFSSQFKQACYWKESTDWPLEVAPRDLPKSAEVVVIGSGFTGLSAARSLAQSGTQAIVLEKDEIGAGASSRNGGIVHPTLGVSGQDLIDRFGNELAKDLYSIIIDGMKFIKNLIAEEMIDCHFNMCGAFEAAAKPQHLDWMRQRMALLNEVFDHQTEVIPATEQAKFVSSAVYHGGWHDPLGATLHPAKFVAGLAEAALAAGAELHPHSQVMAIEKDGSGHELHTQRGRIHANSIILASNGYSEELVPSLRRRIIPLNIKAIATEPLPVELAARLFPERYCYWDTFRLFHYYQRTNDNRLVFGGVSALGRGGVLGEARTLHGRMVRIFPELADIKLDYAWDGMVALTFDRLPHLGQMEGIYYALGYNGDGVLLGSYLGSKIAAMVRGEDDLLPLSRIPFPAKGFYRRRPWFYPLARAFYGSLDKLGV
jgi:glycine/D-amino acid oxidase-like deaminating enzyme